MCAHHTPRGRRASLAKRRRRSEGLAVHSASRAMAASSSRARWGRCASQAHSRTPKCGSSARERVACRRSRSGSSCAPMAKQAQPRTVSLACAWQAETAPGPSACSSNAPMRAMRAAMPSWQAARACSSTAAGRPGKAARNRRAWSMARISGSVALAMRPSLSAASVSGGRSAARRTPLRGADMDRVRKQSWRRVCPAARPPAKRKGGKNRSKRLGRNRVPTRRLARQRAGKVFHAPQYIA